MTRKRSHFNRSHPLAEVAIEHCRRHAPLHEVSVGRIACGRCWELAIRDDEKFVIESGLPRELDTDSTYIDEVAVRQTLGSQKVPLTPAERTKVAQARAARRLSRLALVRTPSSAVPAVAELRLAA